MASYEVSEENLRIELAAAKTESTRLSQAVDDIRANMVDVRECLGVKNTVIRSIVEDLCASRGPFLRSLAKNFRAGLKKSVSEAFCASFIGSQFHADAAIDGIAIRFFECAPSDDGVGSTESEDVIDFPS